MVSNIFTQKILSVLLFSIFTSLIVQTSFAAQTHLFALGSFLIGYQKFIGDPEEIITNRSLFYSIASTFGLFDRKKSSCTRLFSLKTLSRMSDDLCRLRAKPLLSEKEKQAFFQALVDQKVRDKEEYDCCPICSDEKKSLWPIAADCAHRFCLSCVLTINFDDSMNDHQRCPFCKKSFSRYVQLFLENYSGTQLIKDQIAGRRAAARRALIDADAAEALRLQQEIYNQAFADDEEEEAGAGIFDLFGNSDDEDDAAAVAPEPPHAAEQVPAPAEDPAVDAAAAHLARVNLFDAFRESDSDSE